MAIAIKKAMQVRRNMTIKELEESLNKLKPPFRDYNLKGEYIDDGFSIAENGEFWEVCFCERGEKQVLGKFYTESDACDFLLCQCKMRSDFERWF